MRRKKLLIGAIFAGALTGIGTANAIEILPSCDNDAYAVLDENGNLVCGGQTAPAEKAQPQQPAKPQEEAAPAPKKNQKPGSFIVEKSEKTFVDWGPYKQKSPQELLKIIRSLLAEQSPVVSYPQNAPVGCCYGKLVKPPTYKALIIKYVKQDGGYKVVTHPAQFVEKVKKILIRPAYHKIEVIPAKYETKTERIMIAPPRAIWTYKDGAYCKIEVPAEYVTVTRKVLVEPPKCKKVLVPAQYKTVKVYELKRDATCEKKPVPPKYDIVKKTFMVKGPEVIWDAILCDVNLKPNEIKQIQARLKELGYYNGKITGKLDDATMAAVVKFQVDHNLPAGNISIETLEVMGLKKLAQNYTACEIKNIK